MTIEELCSMPTHIPDVGPDHRRVHESCLRSFQALRKVEEWLAMGAPAAIILELLAWVKDLPHKEMEL